MIARRVSSRAAFIVLGAGLIGGSAACAPRGNAAGDSAFGPKFLIDSTGKVTAVPKTKKP